MFIRVIVLIKYTWYVSSLMRLSYLRIPFTESLLFFCSISTSFSNSRTFRKIVKDEAFMFKFVKGYELFIVTQWK